MFLYTDFGKWCNNPQLFQSQIKTAYYLQADQQLHTCTVFCIINKLFILGEIFLELYIGCIYKNIHVTRGNIWYCVHIMELARWQLKTKWWKKVLREAVEHDNVLQQLVVYITHWYIIHIPSRILSTSHYIRII